MDELLFGDGAGRTEVVWQWDPPRGPVKRKCSSCKFMVGEGGRKVIRSFPMVDVQNRE